MPITKATRAKLTEVQAALDAGKTSIMDALEAAWLLGEDHTRYQYQNGWEDGYGAGYDDGRCDAEDGG